MGEHINLTARGNGVYDGQLKFESAGAWRLYVTATDGHNSYQTLQDVAVQ
jgi:nitrogen fixation protein FixH